jgi:hypothetical protein
MRTGQQPPAFCGLTAARRAAFAAICSVWQSLDTLTPFIDAAIAAVPSGRGTHKHYPRNVVSPSKLCAQLVCVAWSEARGRMPPYTSAEAQSSCQELWNLAGNTKRPHSSGDADAIKGWRDQLLADKTEKSRPRRNGPFMLSNRSERDGQPAVATGRPSM